ncbi:MAG: EAL domain-containing protein, partial [Wenzhouxiangellaceae bacterium]
LWITFSDRFVAGLGLDEAGLLRVQQFKGLAYVSITAGLLLILLWLVLRRLSLAMDRLRESRDDLKTTNRLYRMLRAIKGSALRGNEPSRLYQEACRVAVEEGDYRCAWIALPDSARCRLQVVASEGVEESHLRELDVAIDDLPADSGLYQALMQGKPRFVQIVPGDSSQIPVCRCAVDAGRCSLAIVPLSAGTRPSGVLVVQAGRSDAFQRDEAGLLLEIAETLSVASSTVQDSGADSGVKLDPVVGLSDTAELVRRIGYAIGHAHRHRGQVGLLVLDIDGFRDINENFGREAGDQVLKAVADTLTGCTGPGDSVHRMGSDEFGVLLGGLSRSVRPGAALDRLVSRFPVAVRLSQAEILVTVSMGVAFYPKDAADAEELLGRAELALHKRASHVPGTISYYDPELNQRARKQHDLAFALRSPDYLEGFFVHWQPLVESASGRMVAAEALLRWSHPSRGEVSPIEFIPILEDTGRIHAVGDFVLEQAIALGDARAAGGQALDIHVNVSLLQLQDPEFVERLTALWQAGAKAREWALVLEITESQLMSDVERVSAACRRLRALGHRIELDDFGTGYSSLNYLTSLPIDGIKLDRSFIVRAEQDERTCKVVESVIALARHLGLTTVAEGIETRAQSDLLIRLDCQAMQGYLFGRPMPAGELPVASRTTAILLAAGGR